jgi:hypothetical protein
VIAVTNTEAKVGNARALNDLGIIEQQWWLDQFTEEGNALSEEHGRQLDGNLVDEVEVERLLDDAGASECDRLVTENGLGFSMAAATPSGTVVNGPSGAGHVCDGSSVTKNSGTPSGWFPPQPFV